MKIAITALGTVALLVLLLALYDAHRTIDAQRRALDYCAASQRSCDDNVWCRP